MSHDPSILKKHLNSLGIPYPEPARAFEIGEKKQPIQSFFWVKDWKREDIRREQPAIAFALEQAYRFHPNTTAVYFRYFENGLPPIPQIYIYDYTEFDTLAAKEKELAILHRNMWNAGIVPFIYRFYIACFSGQYLVSRATAILKADIDSLPYPATDEEKEDFQFSEIEKITVEDVLNYLIPFRIDGSDSKAAKSIEPNSRKSVMHNFQKWFCKVLNSVYKDIYPHTPIFFGDFICFPFYKGQEKPEISTENIEDAENYLNNLLIQKNISKTIRMTKIVTVFDKNVIYLIKPNQLRYWLPSIAIRDADEIFAYLMEKGF